MVTTGRSGYDLTLLGDALAALDKLDEGGDYSLLKEEIRAAIDPWREIQEGYGCYPPYVDKDPVAAMAAAKERGLKLITEFWETRKYPRTLELIHYWVKA